MNLRVSQSVKGLNFAKTSGTVTGDKRKKNWQKLTDAYHLRSQRSSRKLPRPSFLLVSKLSKRTYKQTQIILFWETVHLPLP